MQLKNVCKLQVESYETINVEDQTKDLDIWQDYLSFKVFRLMLKLL